jgi:hypothetical protein
MKVAVDKANEICNTQDLTKDECVIAWDELDDLVEHYMTLSKELQNKKKKVVDAQLNTQSWDVIN